jgi:hypothetical protein
MGLTIWAQLLLEHVKNVFPWELFPFTQYGCSPLFYCLLLTELLHFISLEMTEAFESSDANKKGFLFTVSLATSLSILYASYVTIYVGPGWRSIGFSALITLVNKISLFFVPRGKISNPDGTFNTEFRYVSSFSPSPTVFFCDSQVKCEKSVYSLKKKSLKFFLSHGGKYLFLIELLTLNSNM